MVTGVLASGSVPVYCRLALLSPSVLVDQSNKSGYGLPLSAATLLADNAALKKAGKGGGNVHARDLTRAWSGE